MTDPTKRLSGAQIAALFGVGRSTVTEWNGQGCPSQPNPKTGAPTYLPSDVYRWRLAQAESATTPQELDKEAEQVRKLKAEADRVELEVAKVRGELLPAAAFEQALADEHDEVRAALVSLPSRFARLVVERTGCSMAVAQTLLADVADGTLTELQGEGDE
jgi:phage terminase Nu1 subunit (DNA packaging protein)